RQLAHPFTWKVGLAAVLIGLVTGLGAMLFAVNIDTLWKVTVRDAYKGLKAGYSWPEGMAAGRAHIAARAPLATGAFLGGFLVGAAGTLTSWQRSRRAPDVISQSGIARTFRNIRLFHSMTVIEHVMVGMTRGMR